MRIVGIVGSANAEGSTATLVKSALARAATDGRHETDVIVLGQHDMRFADGTKSDEQVADTRAVLERIESGDAFVMGTPIYRGSYSGALKNALDLISRGRWDGPAKPLEAKPVGVIATGASHHHFLGLEPLIAVLVNFFAAYVVPPGLYATGQEVRDDPEIARRVDELADGVVALMEAIGRSDALRRPTPQV